MEVFISSFVKAKNIAKAILAAVLIIVAIIAAMVVFVVLLQDAQRERIPVQYSKKMQGRKQMGGQSDMHSTKGKYQWSYPGDLCTVSYADTCYHCQLPWKRQWNRSGSKIFKGIIPV